MRNDDDRGQGKRDGHLGRSRGSNSPAGKERLQNGYKAPGAEGQDDDEGQRNVVRVDEAGGENQSTLAQLVCNYNHEDECRDRKDRRQAALAGVQLAQAGPEE
jgi:hypothetical protein